MRAYELLKEENFDLECPRCCGLGRHPGRPEECPECKGTGKKEELEEIKVTKTLAKKRTTPMHDLATKTKMKRKKKHKDGSDKKNAQKPMNRNVHDLANITLKGEYRS